jgi:hypothetical protein
MGSELEKLASGSAIGWTLVGVLSGLVFSTVVAPQLEEESIHFSAAAHESCVELGSEMDRLLCDRDLQSRSQANAT